MEGVHASWGPDRRLHLWSEVAAERFSLPSEQGESLTLDADAELQVILPAGPTTVRSARVDAPDALSILLAVPARPEPQVGASLRFGTVVALLALELVARGRLLPASASTNASTNAGRAIEWRAAPGVGDVGRLATLAASMPRVLLAARPDLQSRPDGPTAALHEMLTSFISGFVEPLAARAVLAPIARMADALDRWADAVRPLEGPVRTIFRLHEPGRPVEGEDAPAADVWRLELLAGAREDRSLVVPVAGLHADGPAYAALASAAGTDPETALLGDLGRASRIYPPLEASLRGPTPQDLVLETPAAHAFLREGAPLLADAGFTLMLPAWWRNRRRRVGLRLRVRPRATPSRTAAGPGIGVDALVDYDWRAAIGDAELGADELVALAGAKTGLVRVRGEWVEIDPGEIAGALRAVERSTSGGAQPPLTVADVLAMTLGVREAPGGLEVTGLDADGWLAALLDARTSDGEGPAPIATPPDFAGLLRPYQERGLGWLAFLDRLGFGGILADDMGLGKTAQVLALLAAEQSNVPPAERLGPTLVVCPMSLVGNWQREAAHFTPALAVHVHHGDERLRGEDLAAALREVDLVITTYALLVRDREAISAVPWRRVVLDEAQEIKNSATEQSRAARAIRAPSRFALTGTPIENRLTELWTIMDFANPGLLGSEAAFRNRFSIPIERWQDEAAAERLRRITGPFVLRRVKSDRSILPDLPAKLEFAVSCTLTREQATLYQSIVDDLVPDLERTGDEGEYRGKVLRAILRLKQVCNHPALLLADGSPLAGRSGKLERLEETLDTILDAGERALVFTQFAEWGERLVPYLRERFGREVLFLHGGTPRRSRDELVARFETGAAPIFVLSLKAGGRGLNLVAANHVLHYDRWWNPAVEDQASDRAYRIGQTRDVQVRTFVAAGTLEEHIAEMLKGKRDLAARVVRAGERAFTDLSPAELREVLALGATALGEAGSEAERMSPRRGARRSFPPDDWVPYDHPPPIPVEGGLRARSRRGDIGETWWSQRFVAALERAYGTTASRLARGRAYARAGQVLGLDLRRGIVEAAVQGSRPQPYAVSIRVKVLSDAQWTRVEAALATRALFLARLLAGEMPIDIEEAFEAAELSLFPERRGDLRTSCSCPDTANPCKHVAAAYYLLAESFDRDPFLAFEWRGRSREQLIGNLRALRPAPEAIVTVDPRVSPCRRARGAARCAGRGGTLLGRQSGLGAGPDRTAAGRIRRTRCCARCPTSCARPLAMASPSSARSTPPPPARRGSGSTRLPPTTRARSADVVALDRTPGAVRVERGRQRHRADIPGPARAERDRQHRDTRCVGCDVGREHLCPAAADQPIRDEPDGRDRVPGAGRPHRGAEGQGRPEQRATDLPIVRGPQDRDRPHDHAHGLRQDGLTRHRVDGDRAVVAVDHPVDGVDDLTRGVGLELCER